MKLSILHISDLHRDPKNPISNEVLLNGLIQDVERSSEEDPSIPSPQLIIVSGDIIHGTGKDTTDSEEVIKKQFQEATEFLGALADNLVEGDRNKVVIIPGNHDVNFPRMFSALQEVEYSSFNSEKKRELAAAIWAENSNYRWSWADFKLYQIVDHETYSRRFDEFVEFHHNFYQDSRIYSNESINQFDIFDYPEWNLTIAGFNSCFMNDPWNRVGAVDPQAFANACKVLRNRIYRQRLRFAVWHHSTKGSPRQDDHLDSEFLQHLIGHNFSLGFHGHQHKAELLTENYEFGGVKKVNTISASTLAAGPDALTPGGARGYNRVVIDLSELDVEVHFRRMLNNDFNNPIWGKGGTQGGDSYHSFKMQEKILVEDSLSIRQDRNEAVSLIEKHMFSEASEILKPLSHTDDMSKRLLLEALTELDDSSSILEFFPDPISAEEIIAVSDALWELNKRDELNQLLRKNSVSNSNEPSVVAIRDKYLARLSQ